jgi:hypothetical protein
MADKRELRIQNRPEFLKFLEAISKINESAIVNVQEGEPGKLSCLVSSTDNTLILLAELDSAESNFSGTNNIPDIKKLIRVIDSINSKNITLNVNSNNYEYKGNSIKFKYHLYEDGLLSKPTINIEKIKSFKYDISFSITKEILQAIIKGSTFATETNKVYLFTEDGLLKAELTDRARHNTDALCIDLGEVDFELKPIPLNLDNIKLLLTIDQVINIGINTDYGVSVIDIQTDAIKLKYIITSLTQ